MYQGTITRRMRSTRSEVYNALLTRDDFENKLAALRNAKGSQRPSACAALCDMFRAIGVECEGGREFEYYDELVDKTELPDFVDVENSIMKVMYDCFDKYPTPADYMKRIVDRLSDPGDGWDDEPLRLRILRRFVKYLECGTYKNSAGKTVSVFGWEKVIKAYVKEKTGAKPKSISDAAQLVDEGIFEEYYDNTAKLQAALNECQQRPEVKGLRDEIKELKKQLKAAQKGKNADKAEAERIKAELAGKESRLKELNKQTESAKGKLKDIRSRYGIVRLADDLAQGRFRSNGSTRRDLYMFAMAFDMTYSTGAGNAPLETTRMIDYSSDIEKNLFEDYYTNNLMRFITSAYEGNPNAYELDPSGHGINYKNFAEMVYVYFIAKELSPTEKLRRSTEMIARLRQNAKSPLLSDDTSTRYYETLFTEDILDMPEEEFEQFVADNYDCSVAYEYEDEDGRKHSGIMGDMQVQTSQNTAFREYRRLIDDMEQDMWQDGVEDSEFSRKNCNYGLWFTDISMDKKSGRAAFDGSFADDDDKDRQDRFFKLLYGINMFIGHLFSEEESELNENQQHNAISSRVIRTMDITSPSDMTRTALVTAYYYWYNHTNEHHGRTKCFTEVFDDYTDPSTGLNSLLEAAGYQPVNDRNIFDLAVMFSSYAYLSV